MALFTTPVLDEIDQGMHSLSPLARRSIFQGLPDLQANAAPGGHEIIPTQTQQPAPVQMAAAPMAAAPAPADAPAPIAAPARPARSITPEPPEQQKRIGEFTRLTAPPLPGSDPLAHTKEDTGRAGWEQIHNPVGRVAAGIGQAALGAFFPNVAREIPGTSSHHNQLVRQAEGAVNQGEKVESEEQKRELEQAQAEHLQTEGSAPHTITTANGIMQYNPETKRYDIPAGPAPVKEEMAGKTIETDQGVMQWDPATQRYDIKAGGPKTPKETGTVHQLEDGSLIIAHPDGTASAVTLNGQPVKGKAAGAGEYTDFKAAHPEMTGDQIVKAYAKAHQAPERPKTELVMVPDGKGGFTAREIGGGASLPSGTLSTSGMNSENVPTSATRTMAEAAPKVLELATRVSALIDQQEKALGPSASRWSEFMAGKVGAPNPEFTKLRTDTGLLQTLLMRMHVGARGGEQIMAHFKDLIDSGKQSPENLRAALGEIVQYAKDVQGGGKSGGGETVGESTAPIVQHSKSTGQYRYSTDGGKTWQPGQPKQ